MEFGLKAESENEHNALVDAFQSLLLWNSVLKLLMIACKVSLSSVSILVVMEFGLKGLKQASRFHLRASFNPCCYGIRS